MNQRIEDALQVLYEEGLKQMGSRQIAQVAYSAWEDMNSHAACSILNWIFNLYPDSYHIGDLDVLRFNIGKERVIKTIWNWDKVGYDTARFKVTVQAEEIKPE
jgi:hypothetical protein